MSETQEIKLPKWGTTMQEADISEILVEVGSSVQIGDPIASIETDKVETELESPYAGIVLEIRVAVGDVVPVGAVIAVVGSA